jgi:structural maintenance of chromosome 3 (chondroitin sulfate proteoglycan 6)
MLEVELKENLKRRREDIRVQIDGLGPSRATDASSGEEFENRARELRTLNASIDASKKRAAGKFT